MEAGRGANLSDQSLEFKPACIKLLVVDCEELEETFNLHNVAGMLDRDGNVVDAFEAARNEEFDGVVEFVELLRLLRIDNINHDLALQGAVEKRWPIVTLM